MIWGPTYARPEFPIPCSLKRHHLLYWLSSQDRNQIHPFPRLSAFFWFLSRPIFLMEMKEYILKRWMPVPRQLWRGVWCKNKDLCKVDQSLFSTLGGKACSPHILMSFCRWQEECLSITGDHQEGLSGLQGMLKWTVNFVNYQLLILTFRWVPKTSHQTPSLQLSAGAWAGRAFFTEAQGTSTVSGQVNHLEES